MMGFKIIKMVISGFVSAVLALPVSAAPTATEAELLQHIELMIDDGSLNPQELMPELKSFQAFAQERLWSTVAITTSASLLFLYAHSGDFEAAEQELHTFEQFNAADIDNQSLSSALGAQAYIAASRKEYGRFSKLKAQTLALVEQLALAGDIELQGWTLLELGNNTLWLGDSQGALEPIMAAIRIFRATDDLDSLSNAQNTLANIHREMGNYQRAIDIYLELLADTELPVSDFNRSIMLYNVGKTYILSEQYEAAREYIDKARALSIESNDLVGVAYADLLLSEHYLQLKQFEQVLQQLALVEEVFTADRSPEQYLTILNHKVEAMIGLANLEAAEQLLAQLERALINKGDADLLKYQLLHYQLAVAKQDPETAMEAYKVYADLKIEKAEQARESSMQQRLAEFGIEQANAENRLLEQANQLKQAKLDKAENEVTVLYLLGLASIIFCGSIILFWSRERASRHKIQQVALQDFLTGSPNRRAVMEYGSKTLSICVREQQPFSLAIIDLDYFKSVNDEYGHDVGDKVLQAFAQLCKHELRNEDQFGRFGGEEWLLVFPATSEDQLEAVFSRLRQQFSAVDIDGVSADKEFTFSMGSAQLRQGHGDLDTLIKVADRNLYRAKSQGRNRLVTSLPVDR